MAKSRKTSNPTDQTQLDLDWSTVGKRVGWVLDTRFAGNRSGMAQALGFTHTAISRVVSGGNPPGRRLLTAMIDRLGVDAEWLLRGRGDPFTERPQAENTPLWMAVSDQLLPAPRPESIRELTKGTIAVPPLRPETQYLYRLKAGEPILSHKERGFKRGDLLLMETDPARFPREDQITEVFCAVKSETGETPGVRLGYAYFFEYSPDSGPAHLEFEPFDDLLSDNKEVEEFVFRTYPDGSTKAIRRRLRIRKNRGREELVPPQHAISFRIRLRIKYTDIVAVWTGALYRSDDMQP